MATGIGAWISFAIFALIIFTPAIFCLILLRQRTTYYVVYKRVGLCIETLAAYVKARGLADVQRQLEVKHSPWAIVILSIKEVG